MDIVKSALTIKLILKIRNEHGFDFCTNLVLYMSFCDYYVVIKVDCPEIYWRRFFFLNLGFQHGKSTGIRGDSYTESRWEGQWPF